MSGGIGRVGPNTNVGGASEVTAHAPAAAAAAIELKSPALKADAKLQSIARGESTLEKGARGNAVKTVQQALIGVGIQVAGGADGAFGNGTANAIATFQRQKGLAASGKLDQATLAKLDAAMTASTGGTTGTGGTSGTGTTGGTTALNPRFAADPTLKAIMNGTTTIKSGSRGPGVQLVQQALLDIGYNMPVFGADGGFGGEGATAVKRFQRDMGLRQTGVVDKATLEKLSKLAPPPGKELERNPEYEKLFEDGRVDMTIAQGFDENGTTEGSIWKIQQGLTSQGFSRIRPESMSAAERTKLGVGPDRYEPGATYFRKKITDPATSKPVDVVVKLITPSSAAKPEDVRDMFKRALERDEVVTYNGHARYGTGPDFDIMDSGKGNFVMDKTGGPTGHPHEPLVGALADKPNSMLGDVKPFAGKYQMLYFNACTTENYMNNLRDPQKFLGRNTQNTDILGTTIPTYLATGADHVLGFVNMLSNKKSINSFVEGENKRESTTTQEFMDAGSDAEKSAKDVKLAMGTLFESGFADNAGNKIK